MAAESSTDTVVYLLGAGGLGAIITAIVAAISSKRKLGAEATKIITDAAAGVVTNMQGEINRQKKQNDEDRAAHRAALQTLMFNHAEEMEEVRRVLQLHVAWDAIAIAKMNEIGINLPPAPPLTPARRFPKPTFTHGILDDDGTLDA